MFKNSAVANDPTHITPTTNISDNIYGLGTARFGYLFGSAMVYAKGGIGFANVSYQWADPAYSAFASDTKTIYGGAFGGGVEYKVSQLVSLKLEYMHLAFNDTNTLTVQNYCCNYQQQVRVGGVDTIKFGANIHFSAGH